MMGGWIARARMRQIAIADEAEQSPATTRIRGLLLCVLCVVSFLSPLTGSSQAQVLSGAEDGSAAGSGQAALSFGSLFAPTVLPTPEQVQGDEESRTKFIGLGREAAIALAQRDFHINQPTWAPPVNASGSNLERYIGEDTAVERLPSGKHVVLNSTIPLRVTDGSGMLPVSLTLKSDGEDFVPANPIVPVAIAKRASGGISFAQGLNVSPVGASTTEGPVLTGNRVVFANESRDTDLLLEPRPVGAELSWQLRSQASPQDEALAFNLPAGGSLVDSTSISGAVEVVQEGKRLLLIMPATATAADGTSVPVSYSVNGNVLITHINLSGNVDFPVLVDPLFYGYYGATNGASEFNHWEHNFPTCGCFSFYNEPHFLMTGTNPGAPVGSYGEWTIWAPGPQGKPGSAGITRVDLVGVGHNHAEQSRFDGRMSYDNGSSPTWTFNGTYGKEGYQPLLDEGYMAGNAIAFCAQDGGAGAKDGGSVPLCEENSYQAGDFEMLDEIVGSQTVFNYSQLEGAQITYRDPAVPNRVVLNHPGYEGQWLKTGPTNFTIEAEDEGLGIGKFELLNGKEGRILAEEPLSCDSVNGFAGCATVATSAPLNLSGLTETGDDTLEPTALDPALNAATPSSSYVHLYLDKSAPTLGALTGSLAQAANHVIGDGTYTLNFSAEDGSAVNWPEHAQSGMQTMEVKVDGTLVDTVKSSCAEPRGEPASNCFALSGSWTMHGQNYGAGPHTILVVAKDWAGNEASNSFVVTTNEAAYNSMGPGEVNLETGDYKLNPADVAVAAGPTSLTVRRTYDSTNLLQGATGPLGPQWALSLPDSAAAGQWQSLSPLANGSVTVADAHGNQIVFTAKEGGYTSPAGYQTDTLSKPGSSEYKLTDAVGDYTIFTQSGTGPFVPSSVAQATATGGLNKVTYKFTKTSEGITEPTQVLAPEPYPEACTAKLVQGCRALLFTYATSTTATGEAGSEWGQYKNRLTKVSLSAWDASKKEMTTTAVAEYAYDNVGRLRAVWDPRISPALKTTYGYDAEGHVTAVSSPGQQPWLLRYGTIPSDTSPGRLLSTSRFNAETALWKGEKLKMTTSPTLSTGTPIIGTSLSINNGTWNLPVAYGYQWQRCNATGGECAAIAGATNQSYTPLEVDRGHKLVGQVTATGSWGAVTASTAASSSAVALGKATYSGAAGSKGKGAGQFEDPTAVALTASGNMWVTDAVNNRIEEFSASGSFIETVGFGVSNGNSELQTCTSTCQAGIYGSGPGQLANPEGVAINQSTGTIYVVNSGTDLIQEYTSTGSYITKFGSAGSGAGQFSEPHGIALDSSGNLWIADTSNNRVTEYTPSGTLIKTIGKAGTGHGEFRGTFGVAFDAGNLYVTDMTNQRVQEFTTTGEWIREFGGSGSEEGKFNGPWGIATDLLNGDVYVASYNDGRVEAFTASGQFVEQFSHAGSGSEQMNGPAGLAINGTTGAIYVADEGNNRISIWAPNLPTQEPTQPAPNPGTTAVTTIEYRVPLSGAGVQQMTESEVATWGQKDVPSEATAIFPPDEPQSWPAGNYKRANVFYMDSANRTVNTAAPSGAITTTEYNNSNDDVERTLTADDRAAALKEANSAEAAQLLSTELTYSTDGTELTSVLGPEHPTALSNGSRQANGELLEARKHTTYSYDEGAPGTGGPYRLVTDTTEGAKVIGREEEDRHWVKTSYSGQENLGWKLHAPTSTETSTGTQTLVTKTSYDPSTAQVTETSTPNATEEHKALYVSQFGAAGTGNGQFNHPGAMTVDSKGNLWVVDHFNSRVEEFNEKGEYIKQFGTLGSGNGQLKEPDGLAVDPKGNVWVIDTHNSRVEEFNEKGEYQKAYGSAGSGAGQFSSPEGIAVDAHNNVWVADTNNGRLEEFNEKGEYQKAVGTKGSGAGQLGEPEGLSIDSHGDVWVADWLNSRVEEFNEKGEYVREFGSAGTGPGQMENPYDVAVDPQGNVWVADTHNSRVDEFTEGGVYLSTFGTSGTAIGQFTFSFPIGLTVDTKRDIWVTDPGSNRIERWQSRAITAGNPAAHNTQTIYYTAGTNSTYPSCGSHAEWAGLMCQTQPASQPQSFGLPNITVTTYTSYNIWDEPLTVVDTTGTAIRTTTFTYDAAGRVSTTAISATGTTDTAVPTITDEYNPSTGTLVKESTTEENETHGLETHSLTSEANSLGQLTSYTDSSGNTTKYQYEKEKDFRATSVSDGEGLSAASSQTYGYDAITGEITSLKDSAANTFTATYDAEGNILAETYPNGMKAAYSYNSVGEQVGLEYIKTTHCTTGCTWYTDTVTPSISSQWLTQTSSSSKQSYSYDGIGRLTQVQDTPSGKGCATRVYAYEEDGNRTSLTTREPGGEGKCASEGGTVQNFSYDSADRLDEQGVAYDAFGNITNLPAADAGGSPAISTYYLDNTMASQEQAGQKISYKLDPAGRTREAVATGLVNSTTVYHYAGPSDSPAWTTAGGVWTRNIIGINGQLAAVQVNGATPVLQLANLHGDVVGTATLSETESKFVAVPETTEYGTPRTSVTSKYSWLGAHLRSTELPTGIINMGARAYVPELGRFEQPDPQPGGSINSYAYTSDDPVNQTDLSGEWTYTYENQETDSVPTDLPEAYTAPGAIFPPPANLQAQEDEAERQALNAAFVFTITLGGGGHGAHTSLAGILKEIKQVTNTVSAVFQPVVQKVKHGAEWVWDQVNSETVKKVLECTQGAHELYEKLEGEQWKEFPEVQLTIVLLGCDGGLHDMDFGG